MTEWKIDNWFMKTMFVFSSAMGALAAFYLIAFLAGLFIGAAGLA